MRAHSEHRFPARSSQTYTYRKDVVNQRLELGVRGGKARLLERGAFPVGTLSKKRSGTTIRRSE